jgi:hypothetical protein
MSLPLPPHVVLTGEAGAVAGAFALAAGVLVGLAALARSRPSSSSTSSSSSSSSTSSTSASKRPRRIPKAQLLAVLEDSVGAMEAAHVTALEAAAASERKVATRARMGERADPMPLSQLNAIVDSVLRSKTAEILARHGVSEEDVESALSYYTREARDAAVVKAERAVLDAHPLSSVPRSTILAAQRAIADAEVKVHREAVAAAKGKGIPLTGHEFGQILVAKLAAAGGRDKSLSGNGSAPSLSEPVLEGLGLGDKAPLWTYVISQAMVDEAGEGQGDSFKRAFFAIMDRQKAELRDLGLSVQ